ncbi:MAG: CRTAC1 family protein, partial [Armatimonadota bacterium]|nr:CRTAC1 family protein [Armatimonadota bacterium]
GEGRFADATEASGIPSSSGRGLGVAFAPLEESGRPSLMISNDEMAGDLLEPAGRGATARYKNIGTPSGMAFDRDGNIHGGMGADWGDYDNDGKFDLFVATFQNEAKSLYHNDGQELFSDVSYQTGIAPPTIPNVAFGCKLFDFDNDGWLDLIIANGHVQDNIHQIDSNTDYRQPIQLFHNEGKLPVSFENVGASAGPDFTRPIVGRGLAVGDYDNDGKLDVLVVDSEGKPLLLHNESRLTGHWLAVRLAGAKSNRDGLGAVLTATVGGRTLTQLCHTDGSYLSASDRRVHFGLGASTQVETLTIRWPSGRRQTLKNVRADQVLDVREGSP